MFPNLRSSSCLRHPYNPNSCEILLVECMFCSMTAVKLFYVWYVSFFCIPQIWSLGGIVDPINHGPILPRRNPACPWPFIGLHENIHFQLPSFPVILHGEWKSSAIMYCTFYDNMSTGNRMHSKVVQWKEFDPGSNIRFFTPDSKVVWWSYEEYNIPPKEMKAGRVASNNLEQPAKRVTYLHSILGLLHKVGSLAGEQQKPAVLTFKHQTSTSSRIQPCLLDWYSTCFVFIEVLETYL